MGRKDSMISFLQQTRLTNPNDFFNYKSAEDRIKFLLQYAVLAPSTHNSQPWLFKINDGNCEIYIDEAKPIIEGDPVGRYLYISLGCLLKNLEIAANFYNVLNKIEITINDQAKQVARVTFKDLNSVQTTNKNPAPLLAITNRVNYRGVFDSRALPREFLGLIRSTKNYEELEIHSVQDKTLIQKIAALTAEGLKIAYHSKKFRNEIASWVNTSYSDKLLGIPGYSLRLPGLISLIFPTMVRLFDIGPRVAKLNYSSIASAPLVCIITSTEDGPSTWLKVGRLAEEIMLIATKFMIRSSIFVAAIEMGELYIKLKEILNCADQPQFLICFGYMKHTQKPTPRLPLDRKLIKNEV